MGKRLLALFLIISSISIYAQSRPGSLKGTITDEKTGEKLPFVNVVIKDDAGAMVTGGTTDFDGVYHINPLAAGTYTVEVSSIEYAKISITGVLISPNSPTIQNFKMKLGTTTLTAVEVEWVRPLIDKSGRSSNVVTGGDVVNMAARSITGIVAQTAGATVDEAGNVSVRGGRPEGTVYFIDGVKVRGSVNLPQAAIAQTEFIVGGLPAQYGDAIGGVSNTTTKGPSSEYFGSIEVVSSSPFNWQLFNDRPIDPQNYNLAALTLGGPIPFWKDDQGKPRLGFLLSTEYQYIKEPRPSSLPYIQLNEDTLKSIQENPIVLDSTGTSYINRSELVDERSLSDTWIRPNSDNHVVRVNANLQIKPTKRTTVSLGGRLNYSNSNRSSYGNHIFNYDNNLDQISTDWSAFLRFQQAFANDTSSKSMIKNAYYTLQLDYTQNYDKTYDEDFGDDFFSYGHVGKFDIQSTPRFARGIDSITQTDAWLYVNDDDTNIIYTPGNANPYLSNYMSSYYRLAETNPGLNTSDFDVLESGITPPINGFNPSSVYSNLWGNMGSVQAINTMGVGGTNYFTRKNTQFRVTASTSFDIKDHSLILGFEYEQRNDRAYALDATRMWNQMRLFQNQPNQDLDLANPIFVYDDQGVFQDTIMYNRAYSENDASAFSENVRAAMGLDRFGTEVINIDAMDPSFFSLDMFSPDELINPNGTRYVSYYGYDYTGELLDNQPTVSDFFLKKDENGRFERPVGAFQPIYIAGYIQDQFTYRDLTFNIGVRVDRFDLNQQVLKDPYILYPFYTASDLPNSPLAGSVSEVPSSIGGDYAVYVSSYDYSTATVVGYRDGDQYYAANGEALSDPSFLANAAGGGIKPFTLLTPTERVQAEAAAGGKFIPGESFKDYEPQTVVMPRIAFSFPISDEAIFTAHYDILAQRPSSGLSRLDPFDYLDLINSRATSTMNNPNLEPQKTTEYEIGFKQKLTEKTALKISAFYRELRDLMQTVSFTQAYPIEYVAYGNRDFGTVKGFSFEYEMRRTNNLKLDANYTLQFADGTGSSATSGVNLARAGQPNLRYILPLSYDNRHQVSVRADYRFGKDEGPVLWDKNILEQFGVNLVMNALSGRPYTKRNDSYVVTTTNPSSEALVEGQINGSRLPWQVTFDARINKVFPVGKEDKRQTMEVYVQILNLLGTENTVGVYAFTGSPDDDGYLASAEAQAQLAEQTSTQAYIDMYNRRVASPFNYSLPRRVRLGISYNF